MQRRGGTVALKALTEAINKVQIGTDKTAAELAISRLEKELQKLRQKEAESGPKSVGCMVLLFIFGMWAGGILGAGPYFFLGGMILFGICIYFTWGSFWAVQEEISKLQKQIDEKKRIANG